MENKEIKVNENEVLDNKSILKIMEMMGIAKNLTDANKALFIKMCVRYQLNPLDRDIYGIPYKDTKTGAQEITIVVGYQVYQKIADKHPMFDGYEIITNYTDADFDAWTVVFVGHRKDRKVPITRTFTMKEWNKQVSLWKEKPKFMLEKTAIAVGLRALFPIELGSLPYTKEEQFNKEVVEKIEKEEAMKVQVNSEEIVNE